MFVIFLTFVLIMQGMALAPSRSMMSSIRTGSAALRHIIEYNIDSTVVLRLKEMDEDVSDDEKKFVELKDDFPKQFKVRELNEMEPNTFISKPKATTFKISNENFSLMGNNNNNNNNSTRAFEPSLLERSRMRVLERDCSIIVTNTSIDNTDGTQDCVILGSMSTGELKSRIVETDTSKKIVMKKEDLNGISPFKPITFAVVSATMAYVLWVLSVWFAGHFAVQFIDPEKTAYPVYRLAVFSRNIVVGVCTLGAGFSGIITLGLTLLSGRIAIGIFNGELDPNGEATPYTGKYSFLTGYHDDFKNSNGAKK
jgi:hypothetical protein